MRWSPLLCLAFAPIVPPGVVAVAPASRHQYLVLGSVSGCSGREPILEATIRADLGAYDRALKARLPDAAIAASEEVASKDQFLRLVGRARAERVTLLFSGHGTFLSDGQSALCFEHAARLPVSKILDVLEKNGVAEAVLVINACQSSHVEVRRGRLRASVISASPYDVIVDAPSAAPGFPAGPSLWATLVARAISDGGGAGRACRLDDEELSRALRDGIARSRIAAETQRPRPQLRRQGRPPLPALEIERADCPAGWTAISPEAPDPQDQIWIDEAALPAGAPALGTSARLALLKGPRRDAVDQARTARGFTVFEAAIRGTEWTLARLENHERIGGATVMPRKPLLEQIAPILPPLDRARRNASTLLVRFGGRAPRSGKVQVDEYVFDATAMTVASCRDEEDGQCFEIPLSKVAPVNP